MNNIPLDRRLAARVVKHPGDGCWEWTGSLNNQGYGQLQTYRKRASAHRLSWEVHHGPIPDGMHVLHHCDNRRCIRPDHLFLGTRNDNMADMRMKGHVKGERNGNSKLTEDAVRLIKASPRDITGKELAKTFNVTEAAISVIRSGKRWGHISA